MWNELNSLNERLARAQEQAARMGKLKNRVQELEREHKQCAAEVEKLRYRLEKEQADVDKLENFSLTGLFLGMLGSKDERLHQERQEAVAAQLKHDEGVKRLESIASELGRVQLELGACRTAGSQYGDLLKEKAALIVNSGRPEAEQLLQFSERVQGLQWQIKELNEAMSAGKRADSALSQVADSLQSAQGWGTWDMLGGGMIATAMKHSRMDDARGHVHHAQQALAAFRRELKDVSMAVHVAVVELDGLSRFADYFFDNLITDWVIQNRINESLQGVNSARAQVSHLLHTVSTRLAGCQVELQTLEQEQQRFVAQFG